MTDDPRLDGSGQDPFERTPLTSHEGQRAPVSTSEPAGASAPASAKCESCGRAIGAGTLCAGCEQAFQRELTSDDAPIDLQAISTSQLDELFAALEEAQARPKAPAEPAIAAGADPFAPAGMAAAHDATHATAYAQTHAPMANAQSTQDQRHASLPPIAIPKPEPFALQPEAAESQPQYKPIALKPEPAAVAPEIQPPVVMPEPAIAEAPELAALLRHATPEPIAAPEPTATPATATPASATAPTATPEKAAVPAADAAVPEEAAAVQQPAIGNKKPEASSMRRVAPGAGLRRVATAVAAVVAVAAIGLPVTKLWLGRQQTIVTQKPTPAAAKPAAAPKPTPRAATPAAAPTVKPVTERVNSPAPASAPAAAVNPSSSASARVSAPAAARVTAPTPVPAPAAAAARPKPAPVAPAAPPRTAVNASTASATRSTAKPVRPPKPAPVPALAAPAPVVESGAVALPAATEEVAPVAPSAPAAPESPIGPFYESTDVDKTPQVLSRVEPELSDELMSRARGEIVVVRFLVTQTGRPVLVSLLRRSKAGMDLDEAVIAAVKNWSFAPALKRGRAVSCFVHLGVPIGR